jgi:uncharacterized membrane protein YedE/YeeE
VNAALRVGSALASGLIFGIGLLVSGMVDPDKVQGFLNITGNWDPSLALVMAGAIAVAMPCLLWARRRDARMGTRPGLDAEPRRVDRPLILGSVVFGIGWGLSGYCPGPALVAASGGNRWALWYVLAMAAGGWLAAGLPRRN